MLGKNKYAICTLKHLFIFLLGIALGLYSFFHDALRNRYINALFFEKHLINKDEWVMIQFQIGL